MGKKENAGGQQSNLEDATLKKIGEISEKVKAIQDSVAKGMDQKKAEELLKPILAEYAELRKEVDKGKPST